LENILFDVPDEKMDEVKISDKDVRDALKDIIEDEDLSRYIL
jgi:ATP-dependent protease HslVU (ClpYQ) ATPase subunit